MIMKNEVQTMPIPQIKRMMKLRLISLISSVLFVVLAIPCLFGNPVMHWSFTGSILAAAVLVSLAAASCAWFLILNNRLSRSGL